MPIEETGEEKQGRDEGGSGEQNSPGTESFGGPKSPNDITRTFLIQYSYFYIPVQFKIAQNFQA